LKGAVFAISSQEAEAGAAAKAAWEVEYTVRADPQLEVLAALRARGLPEPFVNYDTLGYLAGAATPGGEYLRGMYQPAILVLKRDFEVVFKWVATPGPGNIGGACLVRPSANRILRAAQGHRVAGSAGAAPYNPPDQRLFGLLLGPLLLANGNFVRPKTFTNDARGAMPLSTRLAPLKLLAGAAAVCAAAQRHPAPVAGLVAAYVGYVVFRFGGWVRRAVRPKGREEEACKS
jgi:hypothetical protein